MKTIHFKIHTCTFILFYFFAFSLFAQTPVDAALEEIEQNNTNLAALRQHTEAEKAGNKTGIYLENPTVEFHYLWGNKYEIGNRVDFSALQSFDFPTVYHYKQKLSDGKNMQSDTKYQMERVNTLLQAKQICIELIYANATNAEYQKRLEHARQIAQAYQEKFDKGDINILDRNKAQLNLLNAQKELETGQANREALLAELAALNGGNAITFDCKEYAPVLPVSFESWYASIKEKNLSLQFIQKEIELSKQDEKLQRSMNLPKFSAGYMSEKVVNEQFQGVVVGMSVPLWENKNTVKRIKLQAQAFQQTRQNIELQYYSRTKALYEKAQKLRQILSSYRTTLSTVNSSDLLKKALDNGEISLIDYILELGIYYNAINQVLETERDYQLVISEMKQWEL